MPVFLIICIITMLVLWVISVQLSFTVKLDVDILGKNGYIALFFFGVSIIKLNVEFATFDWNARKLTLKVNGRDFSTVFAPKGEKDSILNYLASPIFSIIDFIYFDIDFRFGYAKNAFVTMAVLQAVRMTAQAATAIIKSSQPLDVKETFTPEYNKDAVKLCFDGIISISIANIIYSLIHAHRIKIRKNSARPAKLIGENR